jgi:hypothetical protein
MDQDIPSPLSRRVYFVALADALGHLITSLQAQRDLAQKEVEAAQAEIQFAAARRSRFSRSSLKN